MRLGRLDFKHILAESLIVLFSVIYALIKATNAEDGHNNIYIAAIGLVCFVYYLFVGDRNVKKQSIFTGLMFSSLMVISMFYNNNAKIEYIVWIWCYMGVALLFRDFRLSTITATLTCYFILILFLSRVLIWGAASDYSGAEMFMEGNNSISIICIYASALYYITKYLNTPNSTLSYIPAVMVVLIATIYANRGGILVGFVLFAFVFYYNFKQSSSRLKNFILIVLILAFAYFAYTIGYDTFGAGLQYKLEHVGNDSSRSDVWSEYISACFDNVLNFFLGVPCFDRSYPFINEVSGNLHNSFLILHSKFGIIPFIWIIIIQINCIIFLHKIKCTVLIYCLISIYLRSFFDWAAFPGLFDVFFWYAWSITVSKNRFGKEFELSR